MKFIKSNLAKKLIIVLIALMVFNIAIPQEVKAFDIGGILFKPLFSLIITILMTIDTTIGLTLTGISTSLDAVGLVVDMIVDMCTGFKDLNGLAQFDGILRRIFIGPDTIFTGGIAALNANIFDEVKDGSVATLDIEDLKKLDEYTLENLNDIFGIGAGNSELQPGVNMVNSMRKAVAGVYYVLRNISGFIMLAGLIFTGIRIILSSNIPTKKGIYLTYLQDWLIGMALLIFSHIIMIGVFWISDTLVNALATNLTGFGGMNFALIHECLISNNLGEQIICCLMAAYLIWLTIIFAISYFKRFLWICVLTIFAPIISVMYAFGNQTKQIYSKWLREYILTVFIQPFHIIVYSVLVAVPLSMGNENILTDLFWYSGESTTFELVYVLIAIGFIRPAEKYMRDLFGMGQGVANQASYDSGKQTFDALKQATIQIAKTVAVIAAGVATAGAGAAAIAATGGAAAAAGVAGGAAGAAGAGAGALGGSAGGALLGEAAGGALGEAAGGALGEAAGGMLGEAGTGDVIGSLLRGGGDAANGALQNYLNEGYGQNALGEYFNPYTDEYDPNYNPLNDPGFGGLPLDESDEGMKEAIADGMNRANVESESNINASNVTITASNLQIEGANSGDKTDEGFKEAIAEGVEDANTDSFDDFELSNLDSSFMESFLKNLGAENTFENIAKLGIEGYKGINDVRDTFFVGGAPGDWKGTSQLAEGLLKDRLDKKKVNNERERANWAADKSNIAYVAAQYLPQMKEIYKGKSDAYIQMQADEKAKKELAKMSEFVSHGIDDVRVAFELYKDQKSYGYTAEEAIRTRAGYERFNSNAENIAHINQHYNVNCTAVSQVVPNAREYYNNGYNNIRDVDWLNYISQKLNRSPEYAIRIDQALKKKGGKINYNGSNSELKDVIDQINKHYAN